MTTWPCLDILVGASCVPRYFNLNPRSSITNHSGRMQCKKERCVKKECSGFEGMRGVIVSTVCVILRWRYASWEPSMVIRGRWGLPVAASEGVHSTWAPLTCTANPECIDQTLIQRGQATPEGAAPQS